MSNPVDPALLSPCMVVANNTVNSRGPLDLDRRIYSVGELYAGLARDARAGRCAPPPGRGYFEGRDAGSSQVALKPGLVPQLPQPPG